MRDTIERSCPPPCAATSPLSSASPATASASRAPSATGCSKSTTPELFERVRATVARGALAGRRRRRGTRSTPTSRRPESLVRQILYGNGFFGRELGVTSRDLFLPDCFGFWLRAAHARGALRPRRLLHPEAAPGANALGLRRALPLRPLGGPGRLGCRRRSTRATMARSSTATSSRTRSVLAALRASSARRAVCPAPDELLRGRRQGRRAGRRVVELARAGAAPATARSRSVCAAPDQLFRDARRRRARARLPRLSRRAPAALHGTGCYTSQAALKRWNRKQRAARATPPSAPRRRRTGWAPRRYPRRGLRDAWVRFLAHQFHDDLTGTSSSRGLPLLVADEALSPTELAGLDDAVGARRARRSTPARRRGGRSWSSTRSAGERDATWSRSTAALRAGRAHPGRPGVRPRRPARYPSRWRRDGGARRGCFAGATSLSLGFSRVRPAPPAEPGRGALSGAARGRRAVPGERAPPGRARRRRRRRQHLRQARASGSCSPPDRGSSCSTTPRDRSRPGRSAGRTPERPAAQRSSGRPRRSRRSSAARPGWRSVSASARGLALRPDDALAAGAAGDRVAIDTRDRLAHRRRAAQVRPSRSHAGASSATFDLGLGVVAPPGATARALRGAGAALGRPARGPAAAAPAWRSSTTASTAGTTRAPTRCA